jgi:NTP pyrophosphatase (non-canonical NTP hydrolase)
MMTIRQYYLLKLMEECSEIIQVASKQIQFGGMSAHPRLGGDTNRDRLRAEINDLLGVIDVLMDINEIREIAPWELVAAKNEKKLKIRKWLERSQELGNVEKSQSAVTQADGFTEEDDDADLCQSFYGADDICGLPEWSPIHQSDNPNGHRFLSK